MFSLKTYKPIISNITMRQDTYPKVDETVIVVPIKIINLGVYVTLPEYNNIEGLIDLNEISRKRMKSLNQHVQLNKQFPACVLTVDPTNGNISLSKKAVNEADKLRCNENYRRERAVTEVMKQVCRRIEISTTISSNSKLSLKQLFEIFIWPLNDIHPGQHALDLLKMASKDFDAVYKRSESDMINSIDNEIITLFKSMLQLKFKDEIVNLQGVINICCFESDGVNAIKNALMQGQQVNPDLSITIISPPYYGLFIKCKDQVAGLADIQLAMDKIRDSILMSKGSFQIVKVPDITTSDVLQVDIEESENEEDEASDLDDQI